MVKIRDRKQATNGNRMLREETLVIDGKTMKAIVNLTESPLGWLYAHRHLTNRQFFAGEKLREDWERGYTMPKLTMNWDGVPGQGGTRAPSAGLNTSEAQIAAKDRVADALHILGGNLHGGMAEMAWRVICVCDSVPAVERDMGWPARSGKVVLKIALDLIADFYQIGECDSRKMVSSEVSV